MKLFNNPLFLIVFLLNINSIFSMEETIRDLEIQFVDAAKEGNINLIQDFLIKYKININARDKYNDRTALLNAAEHGHKKIVKLLINNKADLNLIECNGFTALMLASDKDHKEITKLLIEAKANINLNSNLHGSAILQAARNNNPDIVELLINAGADLSLRDSNRVTALITSGNFGDIESLKLLIQAGADINATDKDGETALIFAAWIQEDIEKVILLLSQKNINIFKKTRHGKTALEHTNNQEIKKLIQEKLNNINETKNNLFKAVKDSNYNLVKKLTQEISMGVYDQDGNNPLHLAAKNNNLKIFKLISYIRPDLLNEKNNSKLTPLEAYPEIIIHLILQNSLNL